VVNLERGLTETLLVISLPGMQISSPGFGIRLSNVGVVTPEPWDFTRMIKLFKFQLPTIKMGQLQKKLKNASCTQ
jgi:hypothetical protein